MRSFHGVLLLALLAHVCARAADEAKTEDARVEGEAAEGCGRHEATADNLVKESEKVEAVVADDEQPAGSAETEAANATVFPVYTKLLRPASATGLPRILGGTSASSASFHIYFKNTPAATNGPVIECGGAILSNQWFITAAECVIEDGSISLAASSVMVTSSTSVPVVKFIHPNYNRLCGTNNLALVKIAVPQSGVETGIISTASPSSLLGKSIRAFGWGVADASTSITTPTLKYIDTTALTRADCTSQLTGSYASYGDNTGCMDTSSASKGICYGDAGGAVLDSTGKIIGVSSQYFLCPSNYPPSFTFLQPYLSWIRSVTGQSFT